LQIMNKNTEMTGRQIIFFEKSPFMSVGFLGIIKNYKIICYNDDAVYRLLRQKWNIATYANTQSERYLENDKAVEIMLDDHEFLSTVIADKENSYAFFFYMNQRMNNLLQSFGMPMIHPPYTIQEELGNKLNLPKICHKLGLPLNLSLTFQNQDERFTELFQKCKDKLGLPMVLQGSQGVSGEDTFLIDSEKKFCNAISKLSGTFKASRFLRNNIPVSVHLCVLEDELLIQGPFLQIIGFPELSSNLFQFSGNDTNQSLFNSAFIKRVREMSLKIAVYTRKNGYKGILGVDYLWAKDTDILYPQELNTRLVGLTRLVTGIQKDQKILPDVLKHIEAFGIFTNAQKISGFQDGSIDLSRHEYCQLIISNNSSSNITVQNYMEPGIYRMKNCSFHKTKASLFVHEMKPEEIMITYAECMGKEIPPGGVLVKVILKNTIIADRVYRLQSWVKTFIDNLRSCVYGYPSRIN
jgi:hypothetical protein